MSLVFKWNLHKAAINVRKHGIAFSEAIAVFDDPLAKIFPDIWHSNSAREIIIGHLHDLRLCLVIFTEIESEHLRIISARLATSKEQRDYEHHAR
ncbi:BrnT family toxin [Thiospirillum jenense]|uniref:BrnT family toxin n=1 Tax=Thiospirillum jenense TaxID=1653858 RepID=A0A839HGB1_9GAMM|nr:BrnT family toxin [Thiospirillum jenense]